MRDHFLELVCELRDWGRSGGPWMDLGVVVETWDPGWNLGVVVFIGKVQ